MRDFLNFIRPKRKSAQLAKERLQIIINHERSQDDSYDFLPELRKELLAVMSKYIKVNENHINICARKEGNQSTIEMNVVIPNEA